MKVAEVTYLLDMSNMKTLLQIKAPHFTAGVVIEDGKVVRAAPIVSYMMRWTKARVLNYCAGKKWEVVVVADDEAPETPQLPSR